MSDKDKWYMTSFAYGGGLIEVDKEKGILRNVAIVTAGEAKGHGVHVDHEFVSNVVSMGNSKKQGLKMRFGHPNMSSTALGTFLGRAKNFKQDGDKAFADVYLSNSAKEAPGGNLYDYVVNLADTEPDMFGTSIVFERGKEYQLDKNGVKKYEKINLKEKVFVEIKELSMCDFVDNPAANPDGLFSEFNNMTMAAQVTEFLDTHPEVFAHISKNPEIIDKFTERYNYYIKLRGGEMKENSEAPVIKENADALPKVEPKEETPVEPKEEAPVEPKEEAPVEPKEEAPVEPKEEKNLSGLSEFVKLADAEGYEFAKKHFGETELDILKLKNEKLKQENRVLKTERKVETGTGAEPLGFSDDEVKTDIQSIVKGFKDEGLSARDAWNQTIKENQTSYAEYLKGKRK